MSLKMFQCLKSVALRATIKTNPILGVDKLQWTCRHFSTDDGYVYTLFNLFLSYYRSLSMPGAMFIHFGINLFANHISLVPYYINISYI